MRNKKVLSSLLMGLLFLLLNVGAVNSGALAVDIDPRIGDLNLDMDLATRTPEILSGNNAIFELNLKVTGNQIEYDNVLLSIHLPANAELVNPLEELTIQDVVPVYNSENNQLEYRIPKLLSGTAEQILYAFKTENGLENNSQVIVSADLSADNFKPVTTSAASLVQSTLDQTLQKSYTQTVGPDNQLVNRAPIQNDTGEWLLSFNISNKAVGQEYLQPGSMMTITDTLPRGLAYISDDQNGKYNATNQAVTWEFEVPSIAEQQTTESLFFIQIKLKTKFTTKQTANATTIANTMKTTVTDTAGHVIEKESKASVNQGPGSDGAPTTPSNGQQFIFVHYGPLDGAGNGPGATNPNPTVGPGALLMFYVTQTTYTADSPTKDFTSYEMNYKIDDKLALVRLKESETIRFRPNASFPDGVNLPPDANILDIYATVNNVEKKIITGFVPGKTYERSEFENYQSTDDHISALRYVSRHRHAGAVTYQALYFTPEEGSSGRATNQVNFNYKGFNFKGDGVTYTSNYTTGIFADVSSTTGPRYVNISQNVTNVAKPIVSTAIEFSKHSNGIIDEGENQVSGQLNVGKTNKMVIDAPFSAYVILPKGIHYQADTEKTTDSSDYQVTLVDSNYNQLKQELVKINWHKTAPLLTGESLSFTFGVTVTQDAPTEIKPIMYTYIGTKEFEVPAYSAEAITNTSIVNNVLDLNESGNPAERVLLTSNQYSILRSNKIVGKELVKGELDKEYSPFGYTNLDGEIDYRIELTNYGNSGKDFLLMNVLPSVGDLGITDNAPLNTLFNPILKGPITLPSETADEYVVYYSTSKNPSRKKMIEKVDWPSTTEKMKDPPGAEDPKWMKEEQVKDWSEIHSFMVEGLAEYPILHEEKLTIDFQMHAPKELPDHLLDSSTPGRERAAWNSFAYTMNHLQPVEPVKIGVAVNQSAYNLKIVKEELTSDKKIAATEFTLYDANQFILETGVSDKEGEINFDNLAAGTYYLQETNARPGYALNNKMYELEIMTDGTIEIKNSDAFIKEIIPAGQTSPTIVVTIGNNSKLGLPETGSSKLILISSISFILLGVSIFYFIKRREVN